MAKAADCAEYWSSVLAGNPSSAHTRARTHRAIVHSAPGLTLEGGRSLRFPICGTTMQKPVCRIDNGFQGHAFATSTIGIHRKVSNDYQTSRGVTTTCNNVLSAPRSDSLCRRRWRVAKGGNRSPQVNDNPPLPLPSKVLVCVISSSSALSTCCGLSSGLFPPSHRTIAGAAFCTSPRRARAYPPHVSTLRGAADSDDVQTLDPRADDPSKASGVFVTGPHQPPRCTRHPTYNTTLCDLPSPAVFAH